MGTSNWQNNSYCIDLIKKISPKSVLDIGVGFGRWGMVCREFLDVWDGRVFREQWDTNIEGIEIFEKNIDKYHSYFYNNIYIGDAFNITKDLKKEYDLIIMGDVLEHLEKDKGNELLKRCLCISKNVLLNVPLGDTWEQGELYENEFEIHRSIWLQEDFDSFNIVRKRIFKDYLLREYATYLFSNESVLYSKIKKVDALSGETNNFDEESELLIRNAYIEKELNNKLRKELYEEILKEESKIIKGVAESMHNILITIDNEKNTKSNDYEAWIYNISSEEIKCKNIKSIEKNGYWEVRKDAQAVTGKLLFSRIPKSSIKFDITGENLIITCLNHPWSGCINIYDNNKFIRKIDLYNDKAKLVDICISLGGN